MADNFKRLSKDLVTLCAQNIGVYCCDQVTSVLVEDISYKLRLIINLSWNFVCQSNRQKMMCSDLNKAIKWSNVEFISAASLPIASGCFVIDKIELSDVVLDFIVNIESLASSDASCSCRWLTLEGTSTIDFEKDFQSRNVTLELNSLPTEGQKNYLSLLLDGVTCEKEDIRQVALNDLHSNAAVANVLPYVNQFIRKTVIEWDKYSPLQNVRFLRLIISTIDNHMLYLDPYIQSIVLLMHTIILSSSYLDVDIFVNHWDVRDLAACVYSKILRYFDANYGNDYHSLNSFLNKTETVFPVLYGIVSSLCYLGDKDVRKNLLPYLSKLVSHVESQVGNFTQEDSVRLYTRMLVSAKLLLFSKFETPMNETATTLTDKYFFSNTYDNGDCQLSLYELLIELFGEKLLIMLESKSRIGHNVNASSQSHLNQNYEVLSIVNQRFHRYQKREGFISLHHLCSQRLMFSSDQHSTLHCPPLD